MSRHALIFLTFVPFMVLTVWALCFSESGIRFLAQNMPDKHCEQSQCLAHAELPDECPAAVNFVPSFILVPFVENSHYPEEERAQRLKACAVNTLLDRFQNTDRSEYLRKSAFLTDGLDAFAPDWYVFVHHKALDKGITPSGIHLGHAYTKGLGVEKDDRRAAAMYLTGEFLAFPYICEPDTVLSDVEDYVRLWDEPIRKAQIRLMFSFCDMPSDELLKIAEEAFAHDNIYRESYITHKISSYLLFDRQYAPAEQIQSKSLKEQLSKRGP